MNDIRQTPQWGQYLQSINWIVERIGKTQVYINKIPLLNCSLIKIQHPQNPLPFLEIDKIAKKYKALCVVIEPEIKNFKIEDFKKMGFKKSNMFLTHTATIQIELNLSEKKLWSQLSENARRNIKKAQKNNLTVKKVFVKQGNFEKDFKIFYSLFVNLTKIKKFWAPSYKEYLDKILAFKKSSILLFAYKENKPVATVWLSYFKNTLVYMNTGITDEGYQTLANYLLVWESLKLGKKLGLKTFDFEGIFDPRFPNQKKSWKNFSEFKKRFHGILVEYPQPLIKCYSLPFKFIFLCSKILSRV